MTAAFVSQLESLAKRVESVLQSLQCTRIQPSKDQFQTLESFSLRLAKASADVSVKIEALKRIHTESVCEEGRKLISQAQSDREGLITTAQLKNRGLFGRNIRLFFEGPVESVVDSSSIKARKQLTRERCHRIRNLSPDGLVSWAAAFTPTTWTANLMSNTTFDYMVEHIEPEDAQVWPSEIRDILSALGAEESLRGSYEYHEFLKAIEDRAKAASRIQPKKRRLEDERPLETEHLPIGATQTPSGQYTSGMTQLPGLQQMTLVAPSFNRDQTQDRGHRHDLTIDSRYDGTFDEQRHQLLLCANVHHSSLRYEQQKLAPVDPLPPSKENREMKHMYTNAPASNISKLPEPFRTAVQNSRQWKWERSQGLLTTECWPSLFPKDYTQDASFTIWCGHNDGYRLNEIFGSELAISS